MVDGRKQILHLAEGALSLFDLASDPRETRSLAARRPARAAPPRLDGPGPEGARRLRPPRPRHGRLRGRGAAPGAGVL